LTRKDQNQVANSNPLWNFTKYLVDREGRLVESYLPFSSPTAAKVTRRIESLL
jgi:glutathione peroxidase